DRYLFCCSYSHKVAPKGRFIAFVLTEAETDRPEMELKPGIDLLGAVDELFFDTYDRYKPINTPSSDHCFISTSYDATTHFESTLMDVLSMYTMITGKVNDLEMFSQFYISQHSVCLYATLTNVFRPSIVKEGLCLIEGSF
ncbi:hypothetical protein GW17_00038516, partial [Ensete ventricosum]